MPKYPDPSNVLREFRMIVYNDNSVGIYTVDNDMVTFFADEVIAPAIVNNLEELGEL